MRFATLAVLVGVVLVATSVTGFCQSGRSVGMGMTGIGLADDAAAWLFNPAGLPTMEITRQEGKDMACQVVLGSDVSTDAGFDQDVFHLGAVDTTQGFGVGRIRKDDASATMAGGGYGVMLNDQWSVGGSIVRASGGGMSETLLNAGVMYRWQPGWSTKPAKLSLVVQDVTDELAGTGGGALGTGRLWHAGVSSYVGENLLLVLDVFDIQDDTAVAGSTKSGSQFNIGAEYPVAKWLKLRVGSQDGDLTFGAGLECSKGWKVDVGVASFDFGPGPDFDMNLITVAKDI